MKINAAPLHLAQTIITGLVAVLAICILGTSAHTLSVFNDQQQVNPWWLPMWPGHFNVSGTKALVGASAATFVLATVYLVAALVPKVDLKAKYTLRALLSLGTTLPACLVTLVTVIYVHILNHDSPEMDTIQTWTCKYKNDQPEDQDISLPSNMGNGAFKSVCSESKFALYGTLIVFLLLGLNMCLTIVTWLADKWAARSARKEIEMEGQQS